MTGLIRTLALAGLLLAVVAASAVAAVGLGEATKFTAQFGPKHTGTSTGLVLFTNGDPPGPGITEAPFVGVAHGASLVLTVPTHDGKIIPAGFSARIGGGSGAQVWLRTPRSCPESHQRTVTGQFQGVSAAGPVAHPVTAAQSIVEHIACKR
ncbi:MAG: hypothetical protein ACLP0J_29800 [Solirubrobacteraceae bacterium]